MHSKSEDASREGRKCRKVSRVTIFGGKERMGITPSRVVLDGKERAFCIATNDKAHRNLQFTSQVASKGSIW